jgi:hypothetical protein
LNISSIRSVTTNPPTTLTVASTTATNPIVISRPLCDSPSTIMEPTRTTPWMAFVPDISGVWRMLGTFEMTSKPTNADSTKIVTRVRMSDPFTTLPLRAAGG